MATTPTRYTFRNTPSRETDGAYEKFFSKSLKIQHNNDLRKALFNSTLSLFGDDSSSVKSVPVKKSSNYQESIDGDDDDSLAEECVPKTRSRRKGVDELSETPTPTPNKTILKLKQQEPRTPTQSGKKGGTPLVRRNTICSTLTPSSQKRMNSKIDNSTLSDYEKARIKLHVANTPDCLPCRDKQFSDIFNFIETHLKNQTGGCMYVCGVPGTGKTLTVRQVVLCLKESVREKVVPSFKFIEVNAFQVTEPHQIYKLIYKELTDENVSAEHAVMLLEKKFETKSSESIVLLVDELDMLCTKKQDVLYNLFDWPCKKNSKWIVVAIANAMNLPEQVTSKISSRLGLSRMNFQPYTHTELFEIVKLRLEELSIFDPDAIVYAARKVAAVSGDARRALEICRRATELAEKDNNELKPSNEPKKTGNRVLVLAKKLPLTLVSISHVEAAIKQMFSSPKILALTNCSLMEQLFMNSISMLFKTSGQEETSLKKIFEQHACLCKTKNIQTLNRTQLLNVCCKLASSKMILLEPAKNIYLQRVRCNMSTDDIDYVFKTIKNF